MNVVVLDEKKSRIRKMADFLAEKGCEIKCCLSTGEFMEIIGSDAVHRIFMDVESWQHGTGIFSYFKFASKLSDIPITFYNAPENFTNITDRGQNQHDRIFAKQTDLDLIINTL